tara:strand:- start:252 stop:542 length:291 start_codon:yes stop_codon:yes gene_type:complete
VVVAVAVAAVVRYPVLVQVVQVAALTHLLALPVAQPREQLVLLELHSDLVVAAALGLPSQAQVVLVVWVGREPVVAVAVVLITALVARAVLVGMAL